MPRSTPSAVGSTVQVFDRQHNGLNKRARHGPATPPIVGAAIHLGRHGPIFVVLAVWKTSLPK
jgi:hypothetical protein